MCKTKQDEVNRKLGELVRRMKAGWSLDAPPRGCMWQYHPIHGGPPYYAADTPERTLELEEESNG